MQLQGMADSDTISPHASPAGVLNDTPVIEDISTSVSGILKLLQNLKLGKAADRLKPFLLKQLREEVAAIIQVIFERSIKTDKLPADWYKVHVIIPVFKKWYKSSGANYMPIFLTCIFCNALEHILVSHLVKHLD